jgi:hypothetical protein
LSIYLVRWDLLITHHHHHLNDLAWGRTPAVQGEALLFSLL